jgi:hypothetical protein
VPGCGLTLANGLMAKQRGHPQTMKYFIARNRSSRNRIKFDENMLLTHSAVLL